MFPLFFTLIPFKGDKEPSLIVLVVLSYFFFKKISFFILVSASASFF